jgi:hypothetical protein
MLVDFIDQRERVAQQALPRPVWQDSRSTHCNTYQGMQKIAPIRTITVEFSERHVISSTYRAIPCCV